MAILTKGLASMFNRHGILKAVVRLHLYPMLALLAAAGLLLAFALQYPLSTTFPIGGDAASHIGVAQTILNWSAAPHDATLIIRRSTYPLAQLLFTSSAALPQTWPDRFVSWMTLGQLVTGAAIGLLLWRVGSWRAAAAGMAIWALTPVGVNTHFEDGTAPQLFSLIFVILTFERLVAGSTWGTLLCIAAASLTHPLSGFMLVTALMMGVIIVYPIKRYLAPNQAKTVKYLSVLILALAIVAVIRAAIGIDWPSAETESHFFVLDALRSKFAPWIVLSIPGLAVLTNRLRRSLHTSASLLSFFWLSFLLTTNSNLAVGLWENRFRTCFILSITLAAGLATPRLLASALRHPVSRAVCAVLLFASLASITWRDNAMAYRFYENPSNHARLHPGVEEAINWLKEKVPADSFIVSTAASRYTEWIPVLSHLRWQELNAGHELLTKRGSELIQTAAALPFTHIIFLTDHEGVPAGIAAEFPVVFKNDVAVIFSLP